jgi:hypothetical protein
MKWIKKVAATPLESVARVIDSLTSENERTNAPSIRAVKEAVDDGWLKIYPIGSIYMNVTNVDPATLFGGTWVQIEGRFLLASSPSHLAGTTGGTETNTLTENNLPSHSHKYHRLRLVEAPSETDLRDVDFWAYRTTTAAGSNAYQYGLVDQGNIDNTISVGSGVAFSNMPPYLAVYVWKRTA